MAHRVCGKTANFSVDPFTPDGTHDEFPLSVQVCRAVSCRNLCSRNDLFTFCNSASYLFHVVKVLAYSASGLTHYSELCEFKRRLLSS